MSRRTFLSGSVALAAALITVLAACSASPSTPAASMTTVPAPTVDDARPAAGDRQVAVLAGGCFWGVQGVFQHVKGVTNAVAGYAGGTRADARYELVGNGTTGHAEAVAVTFDPAVISYGSILRIYFSVAHDPTQLNFQGPDHGTQYRSTVFPTTAGQARVARAYIKQLNQADVFDQPVVTTVETHQTFVPAERYHQNYLVNHPDQPYIVVNDLPKVEALQQIFPRSYRSKPVLVP